MEGNGRATIREVYLLVEKTRKDILHELKPLHDRVSALERRSAFLAGGIALLMTLMGVAVPFLR